MLIRVNGTGKFFGEVTEPILSTFFKGGTPVYFYIKKYIYSFSIGIPLYVYAFS